MVITIGEELEAVLKEQSQRQGVSPEELALTALRKQFLPSPSGIEPRDEWERLLLSLSKDCGVSLPNWAVSSEGIYD